MNLAGQVLSAMAEATAEEKARCLEIVRRWFRAAKARHEKDVLHTIITEIEAKN